VYTCTEEAAAQYKSAAVLFHYQRQLGSIRLDDFADPHGTRAVFHGKTGDRDLLSGAKSILCPSGSHQMVGAGHFGLPFRDGTVGLFDVEKKQSVGICKFEARDRASHGYLLIFLIGRSSVVGESRSRENCKD
jgi:hypothetical protein